MKFIKKNIDIVYTYLKTPLMITDRDFLQKRITLYDYKDTDYILGFENYEDDEIPHKKGTIRAETIISGYLVRQLDEKFTTITIISKTDIKGYIPKYLINKAAAKNVLKWVKSYELGIRKFEEGKLC